jgi:pilus assembly protein CpaF
VIEDTTELQINNLPNLVRLEARKQSVDVRGEVVPAVTIRDLVVAVLRLRPDRIIVGEVRGAEAFDLRVR